MSGKFKGKTQGVENDIFDNTSPHNAANFHRSFKHIADHLQLLNATGGDLKPEKCWWYLLDYTCEDGEWRYADIVSQNLFISNPNGTKSAIKQEEAFASKKTLGIYNTPVEGNEGHLAYIRRKVTTWINRMANGHLPRHIAWVAYRHQL